MSMKNPAWGCNHIDFNDFSNNEGPVNTIITVNYYWSRIGEWSRVIVGCHRSVQCSCYTFTKNSSNETEDHYIEAAAGLFSHTQVNKHCLWHPPLFYE